MTEKDELHLSFDRTWDLCFGIIQCLILLIVSFGIRCLR